MRAFFAAVVPWLAAALVGCGGEEFGTAGGSGGSSGMAGASGSAGTGGSSGSSGSSGSGGSGAVAGTAGMAGGSGSGGTGGGPSGCTQRSDCPMGHYCTQAGVCRDCSDLSTVAFRPPQKLPVSTLLDDRFPRRAESGGGMYFRSGDNIVFVSDPTNGAAPPTQLPAPVNSGGQVASGPLNVSGMFGIDRNFVWDRTEAGPGTKRSLSAMTVAGAQLPAGDFLLLPPPFNGNTGSSDYSVAIASDAPRFWWMTDRSGEAKLVTGRADAASNVTEVELTIAPDGCSRIGNDATLWSTPAGDIVLFRAIELAPGSCTPVDDVHDLHLAVMGSDGKPLAEAVPLRDVNINGSDETDPSLSPDLCELYFARDTNGDYELFRAERR